MAYSHEAESYFGENQAEQEGSAAFDSSGQASLTNHILSVVWI